LLFHYLTKKDILEIHSKVMEGSVTKGVLSEGNLELCVETPARKIFGYEPYKDIADKVSCLIHEINKLHPFVDGNKRTAYQSATIMLLVNGYSLRANTEEAVSISLGLASCQICYEDINKWMRERIRRETF